MSDEIASRPSIMEETGPGPQNNPMNLTGTIVASTGVEAGAAATYKIIYVNADDVSPPTPPPGATVLIPPPGATVQTFNLHGTDANGGNVDHNYKPTGIIVYQMP
jgi:hypothetical protein